MRVKLLGLGIAIVLLLSFQGFGTNGQTAVQTPFSTGSVKSYGYNKFEVTDKYVIVGNTFETKYLDVATGKEVRESDIDWPSIERWLFHVGKWWARSTWIQTNNKNYTIWNSGGKHFTSKDNMKPVDMSDRWFLMVEESQSGKLCTIKIIDSKTGAQVLKFSKSRSIDSSYRAMIIDRFLVVSAPVNSLFFDKNTMKLEHVLEDSIYFYKLDGDYLFYNNSKVLSLKTFETVIDIEGTKERAKLENGILYTWYVDEQDKVYRFWAYDLDDLDKRFNFVHLPIKRDQNKNADYLWGMAGGLAYFQTNVKPGFEIIDPKTGESLFFEPRDVYFPKVEQYTDNDRYIVSANGVSIVCYDTLERKLAWRIDKPMCQRSLGDDFYMERCTKDTIRVFSLTNPLKSIKIPIDPENMEWYINTNNDGIIFGYADTCYNGIPIFPDKGSVSIYRWNGQVESVPLLPSMGRNFLCFLLLGSNVHCLIKEDKTFVLYRFDKTSWAKVFSQTNDSKNFSFSVDSDRLALRTSDTSAVIVDISKLKATKVLEVKPKTQFWLKDGFLVENPNYKPSITHVLTGQMVRGGDLNVLNVEGETVHYSYDGAIGVINGNQYKEAKIEGRATSAAQGLFANDNWLYDSNGRIIQSLPFNYGNLKMIAGRLFCITDQSCLATIQLVTPALYKVAKPKKDFELTNTGTNKLEGKVWVVKDTGEGFVSRLEEGTRIDLEPGKSMVLPNNWHEEDCFVVVQSNGFLDSTCLSGGQNEYANPLWNGRILKDSGEIFSMTHWGGK